MADGEVKYKVVIDDDGVDGQLEKANSKIGGVAGGIGKVFAGMAAAVGTAAVAAGAASLKVGMDFETAMSQVAATAGWTTDELNTMGSEAQVSFQRLEDAAKAAGASTKFTAGEAAEALNYMALAGWDVEQQITGLPAVLDLAAAGNMDLAYASDLVTDSMAVLGIEVDQLGNYTSELTRTSQRSNTSIAQLGEAVLVAGGQAKLAGMDTVELNTALGILADNGIKGSEGGTALRNVLKNLYNPTTDAADAMDELGLQTANADGSLRDAQDVLQDLGGALDGLTEADRMSAMGRIFDTRTIAGANALLKDSGDRWNELSEEIRQAGIEGTATADAAATQLDNLDGDLTILKSQLEGIGIEIYQSMQEPLREAASMFGEFLTQISEDGTLENLTATIATLGRTLSEALIDLLPIIISLINELLPPILDIVNTVLPVLIELFDLLLPPILELVDTLLPPLLDLFSSLIPPLLTLISSILPPLVDVLTTLLEPIMQLIYMLLPPLISLFDALKPAIEALQPVIQFLASLFSDVLGGAIDAVMPIIESLMVILGSVLDFITGVFTGNWEQAWDGLVGIVQGALNLIPSIIEGVINGAITIVNGLIGGLNGLTGLIGIPEIPKIPEVSLPRFHTGGIIDFENGAYEGEIIARRGEMVLTEAQQAEVWNVLDRGADMAASAPAQISVQNNIVGTVEMDGRTVGRIVWENLDDVTAFQ
ncbi:phage tail tape measure protein [Ruminococcaceae bacterium OttesenSCG-928-D13]|nr:phage tail tape measure protein [Ruminococcaceae bacterium OttesenSCG-928-D13]